MATGLRRARAWIVLPGAFALSSCILAPGKFVSSLDLRRDGTFAFSYAGEIAMLPLAKPPRERKAEFSPLPCFSQDSQTERACTPDELAAQRQSWEQSLTGADAGRASDSEASRALFGGIDFDDPRAPEELAARLRQQKGWTRVEYRGHGTYLVDYRVSGVLGQDFTFPTIERFSLANPFVQIIQRADGALRIDAPGFSSGGSSALRAMIMGGAGDAKNAGGSVNLPAIDGTFTLTTDAAVLANNTDNGPQPAPGGQSLAWRIGSSTTAAPMALIRVSGAAGK